MTANPVHPAKAMHPEEQVFRWRPLGRPFFPKLIAVAVSGFAFALLVTTVRIRLVLPEKSSPRKASLIYLGEDPQSRALAMRAREGGPFPSRFELKNWDGLAETEAKAMDAARYQPPPYVPVMRELPEENLVQPLVLAPRGQAFFPKRKPSPSTPPDPSMLKLAPVLYPLSETAVKILPERLPVFGGPVDAVMSGVSWRFLLSVDGQGGVTDCASLAKGAEPAADALEAWLRRLRFKPEPGKQVRWIALGIGFTNQAIDGTNTH